MPQRPAHSYEGCLESWKTHLIMSRLKAFRFPPDQWPDLLQKLALEIADFQYQPELAKGRTEAQVLYGLINNRLRSVRRSQRRDQCRWEQHRQRVAPTPEEFQESLAVEDHTDRVVDIRMALEALSPQERQVCERLMNGDSVRQIAKDLHLGWHAVERIIQGIREQFASKELDGWLE